jgi:hypothetical protein
MVNTLVVTKSSRSTSRSLDVDTTLPKELSNHLESIGVRQKVITHPSTPQPLYNYEYNMPLLDENGEPDF